MNYVTSALNSPYTFPKYFKQESTFDGHSINFIDNKVWPFIEGKFHGKKNFFGLNILICSVFLISVKVKVASLEFENSLLKTCVDTEPLVY